VCGVTQVDGGSCVCGVTQVDGGSCVCGVTQVGVMSKMGAYRMQAARG